MGRGLSGRLKDSYWVFKFERIGAWNQDTGIREIHLNIPLMESGAEAITLAWEELGEILHELDRGAIEDYKLKSHVVHYLR